MVQRRNRNTIPRAARRRVLQDVERLMQNIVNEAERVWPETIASLDVLPTGGPGTMWMVNVLLLDTRSDEEKHPDCHGEGNSIEEALKELLQKVRNKDEEGYPFFTGASTLIHGDDRGGVDEHAD
jgi:hypothetical protein